MALCKVSHSLLQVPAMVAPKQIITTDVASPCDCFSTRPLQQASPKAMHSLGLTRCQQSCMAGTRNAITALVLTKTSRCAQARILT